MFKKIIKQKLEPGCIRKLYSDMFNSSLTETDNLLFKTGVIVQEIEEGKTFEEGQRSLRECLNSARKSEETIAIGLYNFSGERRSQMSLKKEELFLVRQTSQKWLHAKKDGDKSGLVPNNYIQILDTVLCKKTSHRGL